MAALVGAVLLTGCDASPPPFPPSTGSASPSTPGTEAGPAVAGVVASDLDAPWSVAFTADGTPLVDERDAGRILEVRPDGSTREIGVVPGVVHGGEGGLLGLAVDAEDRLYVYSTGERGNRIDRFTLTGSPGGLGLGEGERILDGIPSARTHNGGRLAFGPDGMLYVTTGDAGDRPTAQDPDSLAGKILRLTPDGGVPDDNPDPDSPVYSLGHRNPQGIAWTEDGTMFASEFGQDTWDELNIIVAGGNYGWPEVEGSGGTDRGFLDPVQQWRPDEASPSGIAILDGTVFVAGLRGRALLSVDAADPTSAAAHLRGAHGRLRDAVAAPDGTLWIVTNNTDGRGDPAPGDDRILAVRPD